MKSALKKFFEVLHKHWDDIEGEIVFAARAAEKEIKFISSEEQIREMFEHDVFAQYFISNVSKKNDNSQFCFVVAPMKNKDEFLERNEDGSYKDSHIDAAYWAYKRAIDRIFKQFNE